jgi:hypothetical protein
MANHPPRTMAMDPPHITEFASERYFEKLNQLNAHQHQQQHQYQHQAPLTHNGLDASTPSPSRFILPLRESKTVDTEPVKPGEKRDKSRFFGLRSRVSILHSKSNSPSTSASRVSAESTRKR